MQDLRDQIMEQPTSGTARPARRLPGWALFGAGLAAGMLATHVAISLTLMSSVSRLQARIDWLHQGVRKLAVHNDAAGETATLLNNLQEQMAQLDGARKALTQLQELNARLAAEADSASQAADALSKLVELSDRLAADSGRVAQAMQTQEHVSALIEDLQSSHDATLQAKEALASIEELRGQAVALLAAMSDTEAALNRLGELQDQVACQYQQVLPIENTLAELARLKQLAADQAPGLYDARRSLEGLIDLKSKTLAQLESIEIATGVLDAWDALNHRLHAAEPHVRAARGVADELLGLQQDLLCRGYDGNQPAQAHEVLENLIALRQRIDQQGEGLPRAQQQLEGLLGLKDRVVAQTADLPDAVETLEAAADVHAEIEKVARSLEGLRHWLVEIMLLENAAQRAAEAVNPLVELSDLRRLSPNDLRQAVQSVVESRRKREPVAQPEAQPAAEITKAATPATTVPLDSAPLD